MRDDSVTLGRKNDLRGTTLREEEEEWKKKKKKREAAGATGSLVLPFPLFCTGSPVIVFVSFF